MTTATALQRVTSPAELKQAPSTRLARISSGYIQYICEGDGPVVLALHGSPAGCDQSLMLYGDLINSGFTLLAPSRPGYLGTGLGVGRTIAQQAEAFIELADHLGIQEFYVAGFSCGAVASVRLAAKYPHRVKGLIMESPVTKSFEHTSTKGLHGQLLLSDLGSWILRQLITHAPLYSIKRMLERESTYGRGVRLAARKLYEDPAKRKIALSVIEHCMPASRRLAGLLNDAAQLTGFENEDLSKVECPTLIFHGLCDGEVPISHGENAAQKIRNSKLIPVPDACHLLCLADRWELVKKARVQFLNALRKNASDPFDGIAMR